MTRNENISLTGERGRDTNVNTASAVELRFGELGANSTTVLKRILELVGVEV
jgi:hypothetical protein